MRGQVSLELLITLGVVLAFTIPVLFLILSVSSVGYENAAKDQADATARNLAESINTVYAQGDGAKRTILLNSPSNTEAIDLKGNEVIVGITVSEGTYEAVSPVFAEASLDSPITDREGLIYLKLENIDNTVEVTLDVE
jgi:uncharacterized protein (UPF0333 family)